MAKKSIKQIGIDAAETHALRITRNTLKCVDVSQKLSDFITRHQDIMPGRLLGDQ
jgi:hypothetical protein